MGSWSCATAYTEAATAAAPPISPRINPIPADGFIDIPPVSKVTPDWTTWYEREREKEFHAH